MARCLSPRSPGAFQPVYSLPPLTLSTLSTAAFARFLIAPLGLESAENAIFLHLPFQNFHSPLKVITVDLNFRAAKLPQTYAPFLSISNVLGRIVKSHYYFVL